MSEIGSISGDGVCRSVAVAGYNKKDDILVEEFGKVMLDSYEKRNAGNYTDADRMKLREAFEKTARNMEDPDYFKDFYWHFCKNYELW